MKSVVAALIVVAGIAFYFYNSKIEPKEAAVSGPKSKYEVSQQEAFDLLKGLKDQGDKDGYKVRPTLDKIAVFNGGTATEEEPENMQARPCWADENQFKDIEQTLIYPWMKSWKEKDFANFDKLIQPMAIWPEFPLNFIRGEEKLGPISYFPKWKEQVLTNDFKEYLKQFSKIDDFELSTFKYTARRDYRNDKLDMIKVDLHAFYDLRAQLPDGTKRNDRGPVVITAELVNGKNWKISSVKDWGLESVVNKSPTFVDVTKETGLDQVKVYQRLEAIRRGGYALAVGDINGDNINDMYIGAFGPAQLMLGSEQGQFVAATDTGLETDTFAKSAAMADFDNDGKKDLLVTRFLSSSESDPMAYHNDIVLYKNLGSGKFKKVESLIADRSLADTAMPAAIGDFNRDGLMDFYVGFPGTKDFTVFGKIPEREGIRAQGVYMNLGDLKFSENNVEDYNQKKYDKVTEHHRIYPHSSMALDFDQDGHTDIVVIDDRGNISPAYRNNGKGLFTQAQQYIGVKTSGMGMGMAAADIDNNGILDLVFSNVNFNVKYRMDTSCKSNWDHTVFNERDHGLKFYYGVKKGQYAENTMNNGLHYAGEGLAGLEFFDYNNDGFQDLYVANGLWTGTERAQNLDHYYIRSFINDTERVIMEAKNETQSVIMRILAGFTGDIFTLEQNSNKRPHLAGFQRNRLFRNKGDGTFIEVGYVENVDSVADGYIMAKADLFKSGNLDLVLRNGDPGTKDITFPAVQVFKNNSQENKSIRLKLIAKDSNNDAIGASVKVKSKLGEQLQQLIANNGAAQSENILHFGLGQDQKADWIEITWPNKEITKMKDVLSGSYTVRQEPELKMKSH